MLFSGCTGSEPSVRTSFAPTSQGAAYQPAPVAYSQSALFIPETLNDTYLSSKGTWNTAFFDLWAWLTVKPSVLYPGLNLPEHEIVVALIDTGVDYDHPELQGRVWLNYGEKGEGRENNGIDDDGNGYVDDFMGWNWVNNNNNPVDDAGHGTHVAGTVGAIGGNGRGIVGIAPWVRIMPLKVCDPQGRCDTSDIRAAMDYAVRMGASIINLSLGGGYNEFDYEEFSAAAHNATAHGTIVVVAAGNEQKDVLDTLPASVPEAIAVSAHANDRELCYTFSNTGWRIDLSAPGCGFNGVSERAAILSLNSKKCGASGQESCCPTGAIAGDYCLLKGTSMAAPHVAGLFAIAMTADPTATPFMLREAVLTATAPSALMQKGDKHEDYGQGLASALQLDIFSRKAPGLKFLAPRFGSTANSHHIEFLVQARAEALTIEVRAQKINVGENSVDLSQGDIILTTTSLAPAESRNFALDYSPVQAGDYLIILEGRSEIAGEIQKFYDTHLLRR